MMATPPGKHSLTPQSLPTHDLKASLAYARQLREKSQRTILHTRELIAESKLLIERARALGEK
jgi:hypothetical protein